MDSLSIGMTIGIEKYEYYNYEFTEQDLVELKQCFKKFLSKARFKIIDTLTIEILKEIISNGNYPKEFNNLAYDIKEYIKELMYEQEYSEDYGDCFYDSVYINYNKSNSDNR